MPHAAGRGRELLHSLDPLVAVARAGLHLHRGDFGGDLASAGHSRQSQALGGTRADISGSFCTVSFVVLSTLPERAGMSR